MKKVTMWGAIILAVGLAQAGTVPQLVNYQGRLTDESGTPLATGDYALRFEIWSDPVAGALVWGPLYFDLDPGGTPSDGHKFKVPVVQGYFNVVLDKDTGSAPITDAFPEGSQFVEIAVWDDGTASWESILPRQQVLSAPYAVSADRSREVVSGVGESTRIACQTAPGTTVDVITVDDTGVGIEGALGVTGSLDVSGALECDGLTVLNSVSVDGNVGIGTTSPVAALDVIGAAKIEDWAVQSKTQNGYAWVGGILFQWGIAVSTHDDDQTFTFPIPFPNSCFAVTHSIPGVGSRNTNSFVVNRNDDYNGTFEFSFIAVGY